MANRSSPAYRTKRPAASAGHVPKGAQIAVLLKRPESASRLRGAVLGTYLSFLVILGAAAVVGQAILALCGARRWSHLAPAVGIAALLPIAWATVRLPGRGTAALIAIAVAAAASALFLRSRVEELGAALRAGVPVAIAGALAASLPFFVAGRFGILGTGLDPDMSQHLLTAARLADGHGARLVSAGYPLGPHSVVVAVSALGPSLVHAFDGLALAGAVASCLVPLAILSRLDRVSRIAGCLLTGLAYMAASYLVQGAFKESLEALFVLAFAVGLHLLARRELTPATAPRVLRAAPLAVLAIGAVYSYSFPGLLWLVLAAAIWAAAELWLRLRDESLAAAVVAARRSAVAAAGAVAIVAVVGAPEVGRMIDFASFQTFNPKGPGLGNLFNRLSPLEALGIWPSGDFRVEPGGGFAPAIVFWLGSALAAVALAWGLWWWLRRRELAVPSALAAAALLVLYGLVAGTPYQEAKAIAIAAPPAMLVAVRPLLEAVPARRASGRARLAGLAALAFVLAAAGSSALALVNGPVGPATYTPALTDLRDSLGKRSVLVLASPRFLADEHGRDYLVWELRGGRICVAAQRPTSARPPPAGVSRVIASSPTAAPPFAGLRLERRAGQYTVWVRRPLPAGVGRCPLIAPGGARANPASD
jgi:hypothetical protein